MTSQHQRPPEDEFYVGYGKVPPGIKRFLWRFVPLLIVGVMALAVVIPLVHFEQYNLGKFGGPPEFEGLLLDQPTSHLLVPRPGNTADESTFSVYPLTGPGKTSPSAGVMKHVGEWVKLKGTPVYRDNLTVVAARSAEPTEGPRGGGTPSLGPSLGEFSLEGEIMDSKCYPGVMKPGRTKTHRSCAVRCISGGVPPVFVVHNRNQETLYFLLADQSGQAVGDRILDLIADPVRITGEVVQYGDAFVLKADPDTYELL